MLPIIIKTPKILIALEIKTDLIIENKSNKLVNLHILS